MKPPSMNELRFLLAGTSVDILWNPPHGYVLRKGEMRKCYLLTVRHVLSSVDVADAIVSAVGEQDNAQHRARLLDIAAYIQRSASK